MRRSKGSCEWGSERNRREHRWRCNKRERRNKEKHKKERTGRAEEPNQPDILPYIYSSAFWIMIRSRWANRFCHSLQDLRTVCEFVCV